MQSQPIKSSDTVIDNFKTLHNFKIKYSTYNQLINKNKFKSADKRPYESDFYQNNSKSLNR